jgi:hypothetical protein
MFALRGAIVSLAVFAIVYCALSVAVLFIWRRVYVWTRRLAPRHVENSLFALRMLPFAGAVLVTLAFTVPSFILLEPRSIHEPIDAELLALAACGVALQVYGLANAVSALRKASRAIAAWMLAATPLEVESSIPVLRVSEPAPAMLAGGIVNPRVLVSGAAEFVLTGNEMQAALNHEVAHVRRRDNLKKLVFRCVSFPGMRHLETAWFEAAEMAADDAAVSSASEALDLAAALIKLSRLAPYKAPIELTAAVVSGPMPIISARIERLVAWNGAAQVAERDASPVWTAAATIATIAALAISYGHLLARVHAATEWLVR